MFWLVLSGGAARGFAHIGVYKQLYKKGIIPTIITGTSMGAIIGAFIAKWYTPKEIETILHKQKFWSFISPIKRDGLQSGKAILSFFHKYFGDMKIEDLNIPFACIATDIHTWKEVILKSGRVIDALRATISIPLVFQPYYHQNKHLCDGMLVNNIPIHLAEQMGATTTLAINARASTKDISNHKEYTEQKWWKKWIFWAKKLLLWDIGERAHNIMCDQIDKLQTQNTKGIVCIKNIPWGTISSKDFHKYSQLIQLGEQVNLKDFFTKKPFCFSKRHKQWEKNMSDNSL